MSYKYINNLALALVQCSVYVLPVLLYGAEIWILTKVLAARVDAFDQWSGVSGAFSVRLHYSDHVTNVEVRNRTGCVPPTEIIRSRRLTLFGHTARSEYVVHGPPSCAPCINQ